MSLLQGGFSGISQLICAFALEFVGPLVATFGGSQRKLL